MNGNGWHRVGYAGSQRDDPTHIRRIGRLAHAPENHFFDLRGIDAGAGNQKPEGGLAQFHRIAIGQDQGTAGTLEQIPIWWTAADGGSSAGIEAISARV